MIYCFRASRPIGGNQQRRQRAMATQSAAILVVFIVLYQANPVFGCTVTPPAASTLAGNSVSVTCMSIAGVEYVNQWRRQNANIYTAPNRATNGTVADGYSVDDSNPNQVTLTVNSVSIQYIGNYECSCTNTQSGEPKDSTYISVIKTEPQFIGTDSLSSDDPVNLTCSLEFAGSANLLMQITNSAGDVLKKLNQRITTNVSQQFDLPYITSSVIEKIYFCNISLSDDSSAPTTTIFNRNITRTVQFSVRNVSIAPESPERCQSGGFCQKDSVILCKAEGSPEPTYSFTIYYNGTTERSPTAKYTVKYVGQQVIQCTASNVINGKTYNNSISFTTNVTEERVGPSNYSGGSNVPLIVGLVVGLGGGLLILIIILILIYFKRQKRRTACCNLEQSSEAKPEDAIGTKDSTKGNKGNNTNINGQTNLAAISGDERVLVDNALYSGAKGGVTYSTAIDPSDGGYAAINELGTNRKG